MTFERPPQLDNLAPKGRSPEYLKVLAELEEILGKSEEEQKEYVMRRVASLEETTSKGEISHISNSIHKGFLGSKMKVYRNMMVDPLVMDDPEIYLELLKSIKKFQESEYWKGKSLREMMLNTIQWTLSKYFGNIEGGQRVEMSNRDYYMNHESENGLVSIGEFKGKGMAVCAEKGATAQNLLTFAGLESELIASSKCRIPADADEGGHYYILLHAPNSFMIYDPTNPKLLLDNNNHIKNSAPAVYPISEEQALKLEYGQSVSVEHSNDKVGEDGQMTPEKTERVYAGPKQQN